MNQSINGHDILLIAPTGGGKTLAGFLPSLHDLINNKFPDNKLHTLYISPLKALTIDVHRNLKNPIEDQKLDIRVETLEKEVQHLKAVLQYQTRIKIE